ncbi:MAG: hypothetical protein V1775_00240 [Bacteroidota bacterium]
MNFHFTLNEIKTDPDSGFTKMVITYNFGKSQETDERGFICPEYAQAYFRSMKASFLQKMVELYVNHSMFIFNSSNLSYYHEVSRTQSLVRCQKAILIIAREQNLIVIASYIAGAEALLRHILPHSSNASYESSEDRLTVMMELSKPLVKSNSLVKKEYQVC